MEQDFSPQAMQTQSSNSEMESHPTEILEFIFQQFSSLEDIHKCFNTCARWRKIVRNMFKNKANFQGRYLFFKILFKIS